MNNVILVGRLTKDPDIRYTAKTNTAVATFNIAIDRMGDGADFPRVRVIGKQAENVEKYVKKGSMVGIEGRLETGEYESDGRKVYYTDVIANRVEFISTGKKHAENAKQEPVEAQESFESVDEDVPF